MSAATAFRDDSLEAYVDALLAPAAAPERTETSAAGLALRLVEAAGLVFALPAAETAPAADAPGAARRIVDLGAVATGRPSADEPRKLLSLENHPAILIAVDAVDGLVEVPSDRVRWRTAGGARPWLAGMLDDPRAAVVSIRHLVEEA